MNMNTDYILIRSAKGGNTKAAETIIRKYYANIFDYCRYHSADALFLPAGYSPRIKKSFHSARVSREIGRAHV